METVSSIPILRRSCRIRKRTKSQEVSLPQKKKTAKEVLQNQPMKENIMQDSFSKFKSLVVSKENAMVDGKRSSGPTAGASINPGPPALFSYNNGAGSTNTAAHVDPAPGAVLAGGAAAASFPTSSNTAAPMPPLSWTDSFQLWQKMRAKDRTRPMAEEQLQASHPSILPCMRTILMDWVMEVCEEYKLHRETYYLAMDMYDRFMETQHGVSKEQLQLIGVTCLFIASKIEEIYPPKVADFAYVTDGACDIPSILETEIYICKALNWRLNHSLVTVATWANLYLQMGSHHLRPPGLKAKEFEYPAYSSLEFIRVMQLLDLCTMDIAFRKFSSSVLAASALYLTSEKARANLHLSTGLDYPDIHFCSLWMQPYHTVWMSKGPVLQKTFKSVVPQDSHNIQTHDISIAMLDDAVELRKSQEAAVSPYILLQDCSVLMTPPRQERRYLAPLNTLC